MLSKTHLYFNTHLGQQKPQTIAGQNAYCPFCDRDALVDIIEESGPILWLKNKYPVLADTFQTVLIETDICNSDLSIYPREHLHKVIRFGVEKWLEMESSGQYSSVIFFKNHGPYSGGTILHPHMQIVGLKNIDYRENIQAADFQGVAIHQSNHVDFNISVKPRVGFFEFNIVLHNLSKLDQMADFIQIAVHYVLHHFMKFCQSYNLFFYKLPHGIAAKIIPRFITSPLFIGYTIPQVSDKTNEIAQDVSRRYFSHS